MKNALFGFILLIAGITAACSANSNRYQAAGLQVELPSGWIVEQKPDMLTAVSPDSTVVFKIESYPKLVQANDEASLNFMLMDYITNNLNGESGGEFMLYESTPGPLKNMKSYQISYTHMAAWGPDGSTTAECIAMSVQAGKAYAVVSYDALFMVSETNYRGTVENILQSLKPIQ